MSSEDIAAYAEVPLRDLLEMELRSPALKYVRDDDDPVARFQSAY
ncbi:hypothetical protein [Herbidospora galbida]|nr:hypothetical protein [Herbidospora galbida]